MAKVKREIRSLDLIADFDDNGFALGWAMAVKRCFRQELDIKYTDRKLADPNAKNQSATIKCWTQGKAFCFAEGHVIYDSPKAGLVWSEAVKHISLRCKVVRAVPNDTTGQGGRVIFQLSSLNGQITDPNLLGHHELTQNQFVQFLKTGDLQKAKK